jgi:hypothetical protein
MCSNHGEIIVTPHGCLGRDVVDDRRGVFVIVDATTREGMHPRGKCQRRGALLQPDLESVGPVA